MNNRLNKYAALLCVALLALAAAGCRRGGVDRMVRDAFIAGDTTQARYDSICDIITAHPDANAQWLTPGGDINVPALQRLVNEVGASLRPPMTWNISAYGRQPLTLTVYFERSGSMTPYDTKGGAGQLKKAVNDLINVFPGDKVAIHIVNDNIYPYSGTVDSFLQDRDIYATTAGVGNAATTDFKLIFEKILAAQDRHNVSVLVTDMIYSPADTRQLSTEKIFNEENSLATAIFKRYHGKSVIVNKMQGDYHGKYYPYNGAAFTYHGSRPFYLIVIADADVLNRMATDARYDRFLHPQGVTHAYRFNQDATQVDFNVVPDWRDNAGRFRMSHDDNATLTHCQGDRLTGVLSFTIAANLAPLHKEKDFLLDPASYEVKSMSGFTLTVREITPADITNNNRAFLEGKTHLLTLTGKLNTSRDVVAVAVRNDYPLWIAQSTALSDLNPAEPSFATTTFGLDHFLSGVQTAFAGGAQRYASITINLQQ